MKTDFSLFRNKKNNETSCLPLVPNDKVRFTHPIDESERIIPAHSEMRYPESAVAMEMVEDATLVCAHRTIAAFHADGTAVQSCQVGDLPRVARIRETQTPKKLKGSLALSTSLAPECYYHWLVDTLPGFEVLDACGENLQKISYFYLSNFAQQFQLDTLQQYNIDHSRVLSTYQDVSHTKETVLYAKVDRLLIPRFRDLNGGWPNRWIASRLQSRFKADAFWNNEVQSGSNSLKKIYITRGSSRRGVLNEEKLRPFLSENGFQFVDMAALSFSEQIATAASADMICGPHGAGLANAIFARPGARLAEFCGPYLTRHFRILANIASLQYDVFSAGVDSGNIALEVNNKSDERVAHYLVDLEKVKRRLLKGVDSLPAVAG